MVDSYFHNRKLAQERDRVRQRDERISLEMTKERLIELIEKKIMTTCIGAISRFEENFGEYWGHNQLRIDDEQSENREIWSELRTSLLDLAHSQIRAIRKDIDIYTVDFNQEKFFNRS